MTKVIVIPRTDYCPFKRSIFMHSKYPNGRDGCELERFRECPDEGFPDWCPLPDLPKRLQVQNPELLDAAYEVKGWNACLDEITGGK